MGGSKKKNKNKKNKTALQMVMKRYKVDMETMMMISSIDNLSINEIQDYRYLENRILAHKSMRDSQENDAIKFVRELGEAQINVSLMYHSTGADFYELLYFMEQNGWSFSELYHSMIMHEDAIKEKGQINWNYLHDIIENEAR